MDVKERRSTVWFALNLGAYTRTGESDKVEGRGMRAEMGAWVSV